MALIPITPDLIENVTLALHPKRTFISSSLGVTGSVPLISRPSILNKQVQPVTSAFVEGTINSINGYLKAASFKVNSGIPDVSGDLSAYIRYAHDQSNTLLNDIKFSPLRYAQPVNFSNDNGSPFFLKTSIRKVMMPFYRHGYSICDFSCGNYHSLNFFSSSNLNNQTAIVYANTTSSDGRQYTPPSDFTIDFYINPRYLSPSGSEFTAGTILHLSSTFALSLVTGSSRDNNQNVDKFRLLLQLSQSADVRPSSLSIPAVESGLSFPKDLIFVSNDNSLEYNKWQHVTIRWGSSQRSYGSGSIIIDNNITNFTVPSSSIATYKNSDALIVGNYFEGSDFNAKFFNANVATDEGIPEFSGFTADPVGFAFRHPLQAELHDLKILKRCISNIDIQNFASQSPGSDPDLVFYVPPQFSTITNSRNVLVTPFQSTTKTTESPFNADMSLGVNGFYMNLENFVKDYTTNQFPRLYNLTGSETLVAVNQTANEILYGYSNVAKRNLTILPNDNGLQKPYLTNIESENSEFFKNDLGNFDYSIISMRQIISGGFNSGLASNYQTSFGSGDASPEDPIASNGPYLTVSQRFRDTSSNQVVIFDMSNLSYGRRIMPSSYTLQDTSLSGSHDKVKISIKDDGFGSLYRCDALTKHAKWSSVGNVFYNEGVSVITSPSLALFGKDKFEMNLTGEQYTPVMVVNVPCPGSLINSSSNPTYESFPVTQNPNEREDRFVYITGINLHDENLNVIMRANLAQPIAKRDSDEFMFRIKYDF